MARRKEQNNKYVVSMRDGSEVIITASRLNEAHNLAKRLNGDAMTVQRIFKNSVRNVQNATGKSYAI